MAEDFEDGFLEPGDFYKILERLKGWRKNLIEWAYLTGWRSGKIKTLEWRHVFLNQEMPSIRLDPGTETKRTPPELPITGRLLKIINEQAKLRDMACPFVFHNRGHGIGNIRKAWYGACVRAGYLPRGHTRAQREALLVHNFRRSMARNLNQAGVNHKVIMERGGWQTRSMARNLNQAGVNHKVIMERGGWQTLAMFERYRIVATAEQEKANSALENFIEERKADVKVERIK